MIFNCEWCRGHTHTCLCLHLFQFGDLWPARFQTPVMMLSRPKQMFTILANYWLTLLVQFFVLFCFFPNVIRSLITNRWGLYVLQKLLNYVQVSLDINTVGCVTGTLHVRAYIRQKLCFPSSLFVVFSC